VINGGWIIRGYALENSDMKYYVMGNYEMYCSLICAVAVTHINTVDTMTSILLYWWHLGPVRKMPAKIHCINIPVH